jgi:hypothetical protein
MLSGIIIIVYFETHMIPVNVFCVKNTVSFCSKGCGTYCQCDVQEYGVEVTVEMCYYDIHLVWCLCFVLRHYGMCDSQVL